MSKEREKIEAAYAERAKAKKAMIEADQTLSGPLKNSYTKTVDRLNVAIKESGFDHTTVHDLMKMLAIKYGCE